VRKSGAVNGELIVSGGGAHNPRIMAQLAGFLPEAAVATSADYGIDIDAKRRWRSLCSRTRRGGADPAIFPRPRARGDGSCWEASPLAGRLRLAGDSARR